MSPQAVKDVLTNANIIGTPLAEFSRTVTTTIVKWEKGKLAQPIGHFNAEPDTLPLEIRNKMDKKDPKKDIKQQKTDYQEEQQQHGRKTDPPLDTSTALRVVTLLGASSKYIRPNVAITSKPHNHTPCSDFITLRFSCPRGPNCQFAHLHSRAVHPDEAPKQCARTRFLLAQCLTKSVTFEIKQAQPFIFLREKNMTK